MGLRFKTALTITGFFIAVIGATYLLFSYVLLRQFDQLERDRTDRNMARVFEHIEVINDDLRARTSDWAAWDETYAYLSGTNPGYLSTNVNYEALAPFELVHVIFLDRSLRLVSGHEISKGDSTLKAISPSLVTSLISHTSVSQFIKNPTESPLQGLLVVEGAPLFISIAEITDNQRKEPSNGFLIFTRAFSSHLQTQIAERSKLPLLFYSIIEPSTAPSSDLATRIVTTESSITARRPIVDLSRRPIINVSFTAPRDIYHQGKTARDWTVLLMGIFLVIANALLLFFLNRVIIGRLEHFAKRISLIAKTSDFSTRVPINGKDEISSLTDTFNGLLETTERTTNELKLARNEALQATQAKSAFVAHVSHELRTPIHGLSGVLRMLFKKETSPHKRSLIHLARESAAVLLSTINDILDLSKIESGALELQKVEFSLRNVLRSSLGVITPRIEEKSNVRLLFDVEPGVPDSVIGDPVRLQQILVNLLGNACKFTNHGTVILRVSVENGTQTIHSRVTFAISDTGIGISPEHLSHIFEPFKQADSSIETRFAGTGLGLSIVRQLVAQLEGEVSVASTLGHGTTFTVTLPFEARGNPTPAIRETPRKVLIVEENPSAVSFITEAFSRFGCQPENIDPQTTDLLARYIEEVGPQGFVVISHEAIQRESIREQLLQRRDISTCPILVSVSDSDLRTIELLQGLEKIHLVTNPVSAEEMITVVMGEPDASSPRHNDEILQLSPVKTPSRVIIADDAPTSRLILQEMLVEAGYSVVAVEDGHELVQRIKQSLSDSTREKFDLVITDIEMPRMNGLEATEAIRAIEKAYPAPSPLPIIAITAHALVEQREKMLAAGVTYIVPKPVSPESLESTLSLIRGDESKKELPGKRTRVIDLQQILDELTPITVSPSSPTEYLLDIADLFDRTGESLRRTKLILNSFLGAYQEHLAAIHTSLKARDTDGAIIPSHSIKGLLLDVGAKGTATIAAALEAASKAGDVESALQSHHDLEERMRQVARRVDDVVKHPIFNAAL